jgi:hypothetical protein
MLPMKKVSRLPIKKLALHVETIRSLSSAHLATVHGGIPPAPPTHALSCTWAGGGICPDPGTEDCIEC